MYQEGVASFSFLFFGTRDQENQAEAKTNGTLATTNTVAGRTPTHRIIYVDALRFTLNLHALKTK